MSVLEATSQLKITETEAGVRRIGNTRVSLDSVIYAFKMGSSAEEIASDFDSLSLADVYAVIAYYLQNTDEVDTYLSKHEMENVRLRTTMDERFPVLGLRSRLLARDRHE